MKIERKKILGPTEIWTRIVGFRVQSANHYTMGPWTVATVAALYPSRLYIFNDGLLNSPLFSYFII